MIICAGERFRRRNAYWAGHRGVGMETTDAFQGLTCFDCGERFDVMATGRCPDCGGILEIGRASCRERV